jgi:ATP-dependent helicase HrpB
MEQGGQELSLGEVSGRAENDEIEGFDGNDACGHDIISGDKIIHQAQVLCNANHSMSTTLPIEQAIPSLKEALAGSPSAVLVAEPGAGKTTRVPLAFLGEAWLDGKSIVMLEPRRLAARAAAHRMAATLGEAIGETVGYAVRLDRKVSAKTRIEVVTEGILTRRLQADPALETVGLLIFDEFHERGLDADLALALALDVQSGLRDDLKILVMSATIDAARVSQHLGNAPVISSPGRTFPVETRYTDRAQPRTIATDTARAIRHALSEADGSLLAFLPGEGEIRRTADELSGIAAEVMPLYGAMSFADQDRAIRPAEPGRRKVVLATTIAETSLTIEGIGIVVDSGYKRRPHFDPGSGMTTLATERVSLASADQRRGRAGRLGPGVCYRLWPEEENRALISFDPPEILTADLAPLVLELAAWGVTDPQSLRWLDLPPPAAFDQARDLLRDLDAIDAEGRITPMGKSMAALPLHPRLAHMVIAGNQKGAGALAADLASLLAERDILDRSSDSDVSLRIEALRGERAAANRAVKERVKEGARQIRQIARIKAGDDLSPGVLLGLAFPDRIAQARGGRGRFRMAGGGGAVLAEHDSLAPSPFLAIAMTDGKPGDQKAFLAATLTPAEIEEHFADHIEEQDILAWDHRQKAITASRRRMLGALVLVERSLPNPPPEKLIGAMCDGIRAMGLSALPWTEGAERLRARVAFLRKLFPEEGWPDLGDAHLLAMLDEWLAPYLAGMTRAAHLDRLDLHDILRSLVPPNLQRRLDELAPPRIVIPSGKEVLIDYGVEGDPTMSARLQEMFGLATTPRIADGRARLRIELLSPAGRPLAVTQSLETFWTNVYPSVRSEMRGRYPKHVWPEDPLNTAPVRPNRVR